MIITSFEESNGSKYSRPSDYQLYNNYPNPFNPETIIEYKVPKTGQVKLAILMFLARK